eukprot:7998384-Pyramimonas_sp.AAC.1
MPPRRAPMPVRLARPSFSPRAVASMRCAHSRNLRKRLFRDPGGASTMAPQSRACRTGVARW